MLSVEPATNDVELSGFTLNEALLRPHHVESHQLVRRNVVALTIIPRDYPPRTDEELEVPYSFLRGHSKTAATVNTASMNTASASCGIRLR
jgi:hypothetical protein